MEGQTTSGQAPKTPKSALGWISSWLEPPEWDLLILSTTLKLLLFPAYRSTDFEVHRNWLAVTYSLPISQWYYDTTSEWTLDYPPFFAYFEKLLSIPAYVIDPRIVDINNLNYTSWTVVVYQRITVILTELVLGAALYRFVRGATDPSTQRIISASLFLHPGFLIVDHIHFQYNGFMFGILLWSILMARNGHQLTSGALFAILLNFKHIYVYLAPAYFVYLLRSFCLSPSGHIQPVRFLALANVVIAVFVVSFGPFILMGQLPQVISRLFPFKRGLNHAYWASNAWALVTATDRVLLKYIRSTGVDVKVDVSGVTSTSRGLVGDTIFAVLPNVKPVHTFTLTIVLQTIFLIKLWFTPTYKSFLTALTLCGYTSFMFGWHVHEKAILLVLVPLSLLAVEDQAHFRTFVLASVAGIFSLFPLLFTPAESLFKIVYSSLWALLVFKPLHKRVHQPARTLFQRGLSWLENLYLAGFPLLQLFTSLLPLVIRRRALSTESSPPQCVPADLFSCPDPEGWTQKPDTAASMEFLPLMLTSVYCAVGLCWAFLRLSAIYLRKQ